MDDIRERFRLRLQELMAKHNYTPGRLAKESGASVQSVSTWLKGKNMPNVPMLWTIADIFNVSVDNILGGNPEEDAYTGPRSSIADKLAKYLNSGEFDGRTFDDVTDTYTFGKKLKHLLHCRSMGRQTLAAKIGVQVEDINNWIAGTTVPDLSQLIAVCEVLDTSMDRIAFTKAPVTCISNYGLTLRDIDMLQLIADAMRRAHRKERG